MSKFIFNSHRPMLPKREKGQTELEPIELRKLRDKYTKKEIREDLKIHRVNKDFRAYAEYFIISSVREKHNRNIDYLEDEIIEQKRKLTEKYSIIKIDELEEKISCLEMKVSKLENPKEWQEMLTERERKGFPPLKELDC